MALQFNVALRGGIAQTNAYVRVKTATVFKAAGAWKCVVEWEVFKESIESGAEKPRPLVTTVIDRNQFAYSINGANPVAQSYEWAKASNPSFAGATDV